MKLLIIIAMLSSTSHAQQTTVSSDEVMKEEVGRVPPGVYSEIADDVYIQLYLARLVRTRLEVKEQATKNIFLKSVYERRKKLVTQNAASVESYQESISEMNAGIMRIEQLKARVAEMRAMFNISVDRVSIGLDMPICAEIP